LKALPIDYKPCCIDRLNSQPKADIPLVADLGTGVAFWQRNHQHNLFIENLCCAYLTSAGLRIFTYPIIV